MGPSTALAYCVVPGCLSELKRWNWVYREAKMTTYCRKEKWRGAQKGI